jgi:hypothetical protein
MHIQAASQTQIQDDKYHTMVPLTSGPPVIRVSRQSQTRASAQQHPRRHYSYQATALDSKSTWGGNLMAIGHPPHRQKVKCVHCKKSKEYHGIFPFSVIRYYYLHSSILRGLSHQQQCPQRWNVRTCSLTMLQRAPLNLLHC